MTKVIPVIETDLLRRGDGKTDPIRYVTQYYSLDGNLLAEIDPSRCGNNERECEEKRQPDADILSWLLKAAEDRAEIVWKDDDDGADYIVYATVRQDGKCRIVLRRPTLLRRLKAYADVQVD